MDGLLLKSDDGDLMIATFDEARRIQAVSYLSDTRTLSLSFANGEEEKLGTEIDTFFETSFFAKKKILIAHFPEGGMEKDSTDEYFVRLDL